jgi:2-(1,2-epoxy-1,2-dihydrophenyl)acetyl-CoA isomerase
MPEPNVLLEIREQTAWITLHRPQAMNAINLPLAQELDRVAAAVASDRNVRCVVLTGSGEKAFCAGGDVASFAEDTAGMPALLDAITVSLHQAISRFAHMDKPLIGAINGVAAGAGISLSCACDIVIASSKSRFTSAYTQLALTPDGSCTWFLPRIVGIRRATELILTNRVLSAEEAEAWGIVNRVVSPDELMETVSTLAAQLARGPTGCFGAVKKLLLLSEQDTLESQLARETRAISAAGATHDGVEGVVAFASKRAPQFNGT